MRPATQSRAYVCLSCQLSNFTRSPLRGSRCNGTLATEPRSSAFVPVDLSAPIVSADASENVVRGIQEAAGNGGRKKSKNPQQKHAGRLSMKQGPGARHIKLVVSSDANLLQRPSQKVKAKLNTPQKQAPSQQDPKAAADDSTRSKPPPQGETSEDLPEVELTTVQLQDLQAVNRLRARLQSGLTTNLSEREIPMPGLSFEDALKYLPQGDKSIDEERLVRKLETMYKGCEVSVALQDMLVLSEHRRSVNRVVKEPKTKKLLKDYGIMTRKIIPSAMRPDVRQPTANDTARKVTSTDAATAGSSPVIWQPVSPKRSSQNTVDVEESKRAIPDLHGPGVNTVKAHELDLRPLPLETVRVPGLSFDLSRVLFNPGVYQLQDPRSRVYNFSPYLQRIMPVSEFNFDALNKYITSSRDKELRKLALDQKKKYIGSSSSMSGALTHFHFLLSAWRKIDVSTLSQSMTETLRSFTTYQRAPTAIFLRWRDGVYAVDMDKEYDSANILMGLGKSMEKLFTLPEAEFERYRKPGNADTTDIPKPDPEAFHYTSQGDFLLRSQLDAHDPRLPGTGMFDLKTRAVLPIRMNIRHHEQGMGYQIKSRFGEFESYEREYFDMIRSAFLKYSLQVRMGRMDGIFVAYHNIERIFGFQYVSLPEMDLHLHGTEDRTIGDEEFKLSVHLINHIFDRATQAFPEQSLRFHFETREVSDAERSPFMYVIAEAMSEEDIDKIQSSKAEEIAATERGLFDTPSSASESDSEDRSALWDEGFSTSPNDNAGDADSLNTISPELRGTPGEARDNPAVAGKLVSSSTQAHAPPGQVSTSPGSLLAFKVTVRNSVNGKAVLRPEKLGSADVWTLDYKLEEHSGDKAVHLCNAVRMRRDKLQQWEMTTTNSFFRTIDRLSQEGAAWRKQQDEADAGQAIRVLG